MKKAAAKRITEPELFYISIPNPKEVRKNLLEMSEQIIEGMKSYEKYKKIKAEKFKQIDALKMRTEQIKELCGKLRACLPTVKGVALGISKEKEKPTFERATVLELEQLGKEIRKLEDELKVFR